MVKGESLISVEIERMAEGDVEAVKKLEVECNLSPWSVDDYRNEVARSDSISIIAKKAGKVIGFMLARLITIQINKTLPNPSKEIELYNIAVKTKFQSLGVGQSMLNQLLNNATAHQVSKIWLEVRESNNAAIRFYKRNGFKFAHVRNKFYSSPPENAVVMELDVSGFNEISS